MHVLHISKYYHPFRGGIEKVIKELAESHVKLGIQVTVLCANHDSGYKEELVNGVRVVRMPVSAKIFSQPICYSVMRQIRRLSEDVDLVHVHTPNPLFEFAVSLNFLRCLYL